MEADLNTILLVEDDKMTRLLLRDCLEGENYIILEAANASRSIEILNTYPVCLVLMDLNLPDMSGIDLIREIRMKTPVPLVVVSGDEDEQKKVLSFENGADDFVTKPFHPDVLVARVRAHIRRYDELEENIRQKAFSTHTSAASFNGWQLDALKFQLFDQKGNSADLTCSEFRILEFLIANSKRAVRREELSDLLSDDGRFISDRAIDVKITRLRKKIGDHAGHPDIIKTIYGVGYIFNQDFLKQDKKGN